MRLPMYIIAFMACALSPLASVDLSSPAPDASFGASVDGAGDVNGDGYGDVVIGAPNADGTGAVYVYLGEAGGPVDAPSTVLWGAEDDEQYGSAVAGAGDVDGDGRDDVLVGALLRAEQSGYAAVYAGAPDGVGAEPLVAWSGGVDDGLGYAVAGLGDVDADGLADVAIGEGASHGDCSAGVYVGRGVGGSPAPVAILDGPPGLCLGVARAGDLDGDGLPEILTGSAIAVDVYDGGILSGAPAPTDTLSPDDELSGFAGAGDVDGDGYDDFAVVRVGGLDIYAGSADGVTADPSQSIHDEEILGAPSVSGAGDTNGDGFDDVVVGASLGAKQGDGQSLGAAWIFPGSADGIVDAPTRVEGTEGSAFGAKVACAGDVDADGVADVMVAAPQQDGDGGVRLVLGQPGGAFGCATIDPGIGIGWILVALPLVRRRRPAP